MKDLSLYTIPIGYMIVYVVLILISGLWLFLLSQGLGSSEGVMYTIQNVINAPETKSLEGIIEVATPHIFAMGSLVFVVAHFMLFSTKIAQKHALIVAMLLFVFALFDIFAYLPITFGLLLSGWIKLLSMLLFVLLFLSMLAMVGFSL